MGAGVQVIRVTPLEWAVAMHESEGNLAPRGPAGEPTAKRKAWRFEPGFLETVVPRHELAFSWGEEERRRMATSFGCWQIMGLNLQDLGYRWPIDAFADSAELQLRFVRRQWRRNVHVLAQGLGWEGAGVIWRQVEAWNKGPTGASRLAAPARYYQAVHDWLTRAPVPGADGLVDLVTVEKRTSR
jgi:hypothetical protein